MGSGPSSYKNNNELSFLVHKKITTLKPTYLIYQPNHYDKNKLCLIFKETSNDDTFVDNLRKTADIVIKINCNISFYIDDIIGYCYNEGGVYTYDHHLTFLHNINESDVEFINMSDNEKAINLFNEIYNNTEKKFQWFNLSKYVYTRPYFFTTNSIKQYDMRYNLGHKIKGDDDKLKYFLEKCGAKEKFLIEELKDEDLAIDLKNNLIDQNKTQQKTQSNYLLNKPINNFNRIVDYQDYSFFNRSQLPNLSGETSERKKKPLLTFFIMFSVIFILAFMSSRRIEPLFRFSN